MDGFLKPENLTAILSVRVCYFAKEVFKRSGSSSITMFSGANPARVARKWIAKDIRILSSQSECSFNTFSFTHFLHRLCVHIVSHTCLPIPIVAAQQRHLSGHARVQHL